jgi:hypothetical protein
VPCVVLLGCIPLGLLEVETQPAISVHCPGPVHWLVDRVCLGVSRKSSGAIFPWTTQKVPAMEMASWEAAFGPVCGEAKSSSMAWD